METFEVISLNLYQLPLYIEHRIVCCSVGAENALEKYWKMLSNNFSLSVCLKLSQF